MTDRHSEAAEPAVTKRLRPVLKVATYAHMTSMKELKARVEELEVDLRYRDDQIKELRAERPVLDRPNY